MYDIIIIGRGPAGLSAALYTVRANLKTLVIGKGNSALKKADKIENYFGFSEPVSGEMLLREGEKQVLRLGTEIIEDEVVSIEQDQNFHIHTPNGKYEAKAVLLATGQTQKKVKIGNLDDFVGKGVSYCTTCDGFFYRGRKVGILGFKDYAIHEAMEMEVFTKDIIIYTNGASLDISDSFREKVTRFKFNFNKIAKLEGNDFLRKIVFEDGTSEEIDGLFVAYDSASSIDFARKLGIMTEGNSISVDRNQQTNIPGIFAAGDCTGGLKQIATAVGEGALAARRIIEYVRSL
ncbi:MAG TPA: NAD(P)/FAD-dependent oxidoreductase [Clostridiaceae bacterium]|nr:NAD(P)/FAD-dependent oxidoreductase [Clostridiaceae bacterium]